MEQEQPKSVILELAHVLFMDIVSYSLLSMDQQQRTLRRLQEAVRATGEFARTEKTEKLVRLPTGDGMALVFFGDPESPVRCAVQLAQVLRRDPEIKLRMGVHTGPVYHVADINSNRNVSGGGINLAQRVMDCGDAGHILVSSAVAEVLNQIGNWTPQLHDLGEIEVKHGQRIRVFNLYSREFGNSEVPAKAKKTAQPERPAAVSPVQAPKPSSTPVVGQQVSHYRILKMLGNGATGLVYEAQDLRLGRHVALKFLPQERSPSRASLERFQQEAQTLSSINHPNVCMVHEADEFQGRYFIVMEFLEGDTLKHLIARKRVRAEDTAGLGMQIADALDGAHSRGVIHRDLQPANVFVTKSGQVKILGFGLAKFASSTQNPSDSSTQSTESGVIGTISYMSPEQARGEPLDARTDLFSLGAVLYEMATGVQPFRGETSALIFEALLSRVQVPPSRLNPKLPPGLEKIINKALEKDRDLRYQRASELRADLKHLQRDSGAAMPAARVAVPSSGARAAVKTELQVLRIAVLPLENADGSPETEFWSEGLTDSLISSLSQIPNLRVISRTSVFRYKNSRSGPAEVARELGVSAVLAGRMAASGDCLSINLELIDSKDDSVIWSGRFNPAIKELVTVEKEIVQAVAEKLELRLTGTAKKQVPKRSTEDPQAFQLYLKGRYYWNRHSEESLRKGLEYFNRAIEIDPAYALAYAGVADSYSMLVWNIMLSAREGLPKAKAAATKALEIDPRLAEAYSALAFVKLFYDWDWPGAEKAFQKAIQLNPNYEVARQWYAMELAALGRHSEAVRETERALQLDPLSLSINTTSALSYYLFREYERALEQVQRALELDPKFVPAHFVCGCIYEQMRKFPEALEQFQTAVDLSGRLPIFLGALGHGWASAGNREEVGKILQELEAAPRGKYRASYCIAEINVGLGENDRALEWLQRAFEERATWMIFLKVHPTFERLHGTAGFQYLLRGLGLDR